MRKSICFLIAVFVCVKSLSAKEIALVKSKLDNDMNYGTFDFSIIKFIDARLNKIKVVGYTRVGMANKKDSLTLPVNFGSFCTGFFTEMSKVKKAKTNFVAVINQITIQETHNGGIEYSNVILSIDYYTLDTNEVLSRPFYSSLVRTHGSSGIDVTTMHGSLLTEAFLVSFARLNEYFKSKAVPKVNTTVGKLNLTKVLEQHDTVVVQDSTLKDGVYFSCKQLATNNPDTLRKNFLLTIDTTKSEIDFDENNPFLKQNTIYAFVKNGKLYISNSYYKFYSGGIDGRFVYLKNISLKKNSIAATMGAVVLGSLFGAVGGLAGQGIKAVSAKTIKLDRLYVDLETGLLDLAP